MSGALSGTAVVETPSKLPPWLSATAVSSLWDNSDSPEVSVSIFAIDASEDAMCIVFDIPYDCKIDEIYERSIIKTKHCMAGMDVHRL